MVFDHKDEQRGKNKENKGVFVFGSSFSGLGSSGVLVFETTTKIQCEEY